MLLPLMVRGYAQIASTAYAHPASKMVALHGLSASEVVLDQGLTASDTAGVQGFTASEMAGSSEPHKIKDLRVFRYSNSALKPSQGLGRCLRTLRFVRTPAP